jgi:Big-like domain-containing protein
MLNSLKRSDHVRYLWIAAALAAGLVGCENGPSNPSEVDLARSVRIRQGDMALRSGSVAQLAGEVLDASGGALPGLRLSWSSNDPHIASVDTTGVVSAVTPGAALVIARYGELADTVEITVLPAPVAALGVWPDTNVLFTGMTRTLSLAVVRGFGWSYEPAESWSTSDASVAIVENGVVTAVGVGHATVTARLEDRVSPPIHVFVMSAPSPPLRFSTGSGTCGLTTDGLLYCWGYPFPGMAGPFDRCPRPSRSGIYGYRCGEIPRLVSADLRFKTLAGDVSAGCAVTVDGALYCWGDNAHGGLGLGFKDDVTRGLTRVPVDGEFVEVSGGFSAHCARRIDGVILCWGWNFRGDAGIGLMPLADVTEPTPINTSVRFRKLSPGGNCGLAADSTAYCWGSFVGDVAFEGCNTACNPSPVQVKLEKLVDLGTSSTYCGIGVSGRAYCWGFHGHPDPYRYPEPQEVPNPGIRSFEMGLYALDGSGAAFEINTWGVLWRFHALDTGALRYKRYWGTCGVALDDRVYCGKLLPGQ